MGFFNKYYFETHKDVLLLFVTYLGCGVDRRAADFTILYSEFKADHRPPRARRAAKMWEWECTPTVRQTEHHDLAVP